MQAILAALEEGDVALVSEAGMPGLADPGYELITAALERDVPVVPIPGPTALAAALSVAGHTQRAFRLPWVSAAGWRPPRAAGLLVDNPFTLVAYESPHRLLETLDDLDRLFGDRPMAVACELTKLYEEIQRGTAAEMLAHFRDHKPRGEFTLVIAGGLRPAPSRRQRARNEGGGRS